MFWKSVLLKHLYFKYLTTVVCWLTKDEFVLSFSRVKKYYSMLLIIRIAFPKVTLYMKILPHNVMSIKNLFIIQLGFISNFFNFLPPSPLSLINFATATPITFTYSRHAKIQEFSLSLDRIICLHVHFLYQFSSNILKWNQ